MKQHKENVEGPGIKARGSTMPAKSARHHIGEPFSATS